MNDELVKRLRDYADYRTTAPQLSADLYAAADLIEGQETTASKVRGVVEEWLKGCSNAPAGEPEECTECTREALAAIRFITSEQAS